MFIFEDFKTMSIFLALYFELISETRNINVFHPSIAWRNRLARPRRRLVETQTSSAPMHKRHLGRKV